MCHILSLSSASSSCHLFARLAAALCIVRLRRGACQTLEGSAARARAQKGELDRMWWREAAEQGEGPAGGGQAGAPADEAGLDTWQARTCTPYKNLLHV